MAEHVHVGVTGSSGFIGSALVAALQERGDTVTRFVRPTSPRAGRVVRWDPARGLVDDTDLASVGGFDAVVNLSGTGIADKRWSDARKKEILTSRTASTSLLVEILGRSPQSTSMLASGSAIGYYGTRADEILDETSSQGTGYLADVCARWEAEALTLASQGTKVALLRTGIVMDRRGGSLKRQLPLFRFGLGGTLAGGGQWVSPIALDDEVRAILWIIDSRLEGPVNLTCPTPLTNREFTSVLARKMHRPALFPVPGFGLNVVLGAELAVEAVLASQRVLPKTLTETGFSFDDPDIASIIDAALAH
jgi:uncharacterized protein (TIGR01777 family)